MRIDMMQGSNLCATRIKLVAALQTEKARILTGPWRNNLVVSASNSAVFSDRFDFLRLLGHALVNFVFVFFQQLLDLFLQRLDLVFGESAARF